MQIRPMIDEDVPAVCDLLRACYRWLAAREGLTKAQLDYLVNERSSEETVRHEAESRIHLVATVEDKVVGMGVVHGNEVARLYVHPDAHRQRIGRALFQAAEAIVRANGFREITVAALVEGAVAFYKSVGMTSQRRQPWQPEIFGGREVTIMSKPL